MNKQAHMTAVAEQLSDMAETANGVKGTPFASAVTTLFALDGLRDLSRRLVDALPVAKKYTAAIDALHANVEAYILDCIPEAERQEARQYATRMFDEQRSLHDRIKREGN